MTNFTSNVGGAKAGGTDSLFRRHFELVQEEPPVCRK